MIRKTKFLVFRPGKDSLNSLNSALSGDKWAIFGLLPLREVGQCPAGPQLTLCQSRVFNVRSYSSYWAGRNCSYFYLGWYCKSHLTVTENVNHLECGGRRGVRWLERGFDSWCLFLHSRPTLKLKTGDFLQRNHQRSPRDCPDQSFQHMLPTRLSNGPGTSAITC